MAILKYLLLKTNANQLPNQVTNYVDRLRCIKSRKPNPRIKNVTAFEKIKRYLHPNDACRLFNRKIHTTVPLQVQKSKKFRTPYFAKVYRNSFSWMRNKLDFWILRKAWDPGFNEKEFIRGATQALVLVSQLVAKRDLRSLQEFVTPSALTFIDKDIQSGFPSEHLHLLQFETHDVKLVLPIRLYFMLNQGNRECDIDCLFVALRRFEDIYSEETFFRRKLTPDQKKKRDTGVNPIEQKSFSDEVIRKTAHVVAALRDHKRSINSNETQTDPNKSKDITKFEKNIILQAKKATANEDGDNCDSKERMNALKKSIEKTIKGILNKKKFNFMDDRRESFRRGFPNAQTHLVGNPRDILFMEMFARFHRNYSSATDDQWSVAHYKVTHIEVLRERRRQF